MQPNPPVNVGLFDDGVNFYDEEKL